MKYLLPLLLAIFHLVTSCNYIPCSSSSDLNAVDQNPKTSLIAGIYKPDKFTKVDFKEYSNTDTTVMIVKEDGKILLKNFPIETFDEGNLSHKKINASGTWWFDINSGKTNIRTKITFDQPGIIQPSPFKLFKKDVKYYILIDFGCMLLG